MKIQHKTMVYYATKIYFFNALKAMKIKLIFKINSKEMWWN